MGWELFLDNLEGKMKKVIKESKRLESFSGYVAIIFGLLMFFGIILMGIAENNSICNESVDYSLAGMVFGIGVYGCILAFFIFVVATIGETSSSENKKEEKDEQ